MHSNIIDSGFLLCAIIMPSLPVERYKTGKNCKILKMCPFATIVTNRETMKRKQSSWQSQCSCNWGSKNVYKTFFFMLYCLGHQHKAMLITGMQGGEFYFDNSEVWKFQFLQAILSINYLQCILFVVSFGISNLIIQIWNKSCCIMSACWILLVSTEQTTFRRRNAS